MKSNFLPIDLGRPNSFIFDFDSTIVTIETLDTLIKKNLKDDEDRRRIDDITTRAMNGELDFNASITLRLSLARVTTEHFAQMARQIEDFLTPGMADFLNFLRRKGQQLFVVSGGFLEIIRPITVRFDIPESNCFANEYVHDADDNVVGVKDGPLIYEDGKSTVVRELIRQNRLPGVIVMLGDGMSDYRVYAEGLADLFIGCG
ncbi:MAG: HAD-IB family phosphatase, partial [Synergistaceae bacterium]|nr:HAD-IB family phosphatase [Synergistaceae bacterium]